MIDKTLFKSVLDKEYSIEDNFNSICLKIKDSEMKRNNQTNKFKIAIITSLFILMPLVTVQAIKIPLINKIIFNSPSVGEAVKNEISKTIDMDYIYSENIGIKINSILFTDTDIFIALSGIFTKELNLEEGEMIFFDYIIYDELGNYYTAGYESDEQYISSGYTGGGFYYYFNEELETSLELHASVQYPKVDKLYIRIYNFTRQKEGKNNKYIDDDIFIELDMTNLNTTGSEEYEVVEEIEGINIEKFIISESGTILIANGNIRKNSCFNR